MTLPWSVAVQTTSAPASLATYQAFCEAKPPFGLGYDPGDVEVIIRERTTRAAQEQAENPLPIGNHRGRCIDSDTTNTPIGRGVDYLTARIARDHPEILDQMKAGGFPSVRAAAKAAGIVRPTATFYTDRPEDAARAILKHFREARGDARGCAGVAARAGAGFDDESGERYTYCC